MQWPTSCVKEKTPDPEEACILVHWEGLEVFAPEVNTRLRQGAQAYLGQEECQADHHSRFGVE